MKYESIKEILKDKGLKITPQRIAVLKAVSGMNNHPTTELIIDSIKEEYPDIAVGTVYKILETFVDKGILKRVKTEMGIMHFDAIIENHHHLYCSDSDRIEDYYDEELDTLLKEYFKNRKIKGFKIEDIKLHINGKFKNKN